LRLSPPRPSATLSPSIRTPPASTTMISRRVVGLDLDLHRPEQRCLALLVS
jgi:hypothetical protein